MQQAMLIVKAENVRPNLLLVSHISSQKSETKIAELLSHYLSRFFWHLCIKNQSQAFFMMLEYRLLMAEINSLLQ